jgi:hypothetical protein
VPVGRPVRRRVGQAADLPASRAIQAGRRAILAASPRVPVDGLPVVSRQAQAGVRPAEAEAARVVAAAAVVADKVAARAGRRRVTNRARSALAGAA